MQDYNMEINTQQKSESGKQFDRIYEEHHDPLKREENKLKENREKREREITLDAGLDFI